MIRMDIATLGSGRNFLKSAPLWRVAIAFIAAESPSVLQHLIGRLPVAAAGDLFT